MQSKAYRPLLSTPAELLAQQRGQHGDHALHEVDAGGPRPRLDVQRGEGRDEGRDIG